MATGIVRLLLLGILFHAVFLWSIFDIYFVSPVVPVQQRFAPPRAEAPAKRVVVISADGLRADKLFQLYPDPPFEHLQPLPDTGPYHLADAHQSVSASPEGHTNPAPYLRSLIKEGTAAWGVSHTRVPTESRPGHVAMLAGMYEDVSAVLKGWQTNPVHFDSALNQSAHAWAYGSPDIIPMFHLGASPPDKVDMACYDANDEDYSRDAIELDLWVLEKARELFNNATSSESLQHQLAQPGNLFFFHLLGLDTTGHSYRPHSPEYYRNIAVVDRIVETLVFMFEQYFKHLDGDESQTAFVLTADHGMSNIGNHGDGHPDNTRTPIVAWGAGIQAHPEDGEPWPDAHDAYSRAWELNDTPRQDMEQADITALISALVGNAYPGNSVGRLPVSYLKANPKYRAEALLANARGVLEQFSLAHDTKASQTRYGFKPFPSATPEQLLTRYATLTQGLDTLHSSSSMSTDIRNLVELSLKGLRYVHTYDWLVLRSIVVIGYLGWMSTAATFILRHFVFSDQPELLGSSPLKLWQMAVATIPLLFIASNFSFESTPLSYWVYLGFAAYLTFLTIRDLKPLQLLFVKASRQPKDSASTAFAVFAVLETMVVGYFQRQTWFAGMTLLAVSGWFWLESHGKKVIWTILCLLTGSFTLFDVEREESMLLVGIGGFAFILPMLLYHEFTLSEKTQGLILVQLIFILLAIVTASVSVASLQAKQGLPGFCQGAGWVLLALSLVQPIYLTRAVVDRFERLVLLVFSFVPIYVTLSMSYESFFYLFFSTLVVLWVLFEPKPSTSRVTFQGLVQEEEDLIAKEKAEKEGRAFIVEVPKTPIKPATLGVQDLRRACIVLVFLHLAFFGTGNVASVSSFYLEPVYRLVPVFSPFLMATLLLYKIMIPFSILASSVTILNRELNLPTFAIFLVALCVSDVLTVNFFWLVKDEGSWLDIGQSISHFAISNLLLMFCGILNLIGAWLMQ